MVNKYNTNKRNKNPFSRPWIYNNGIASAGGSKIGLKGIIAGSITGAIEISITYPAEFVKTQLQLEEKVGSNSKKYNGAIDCVKKTLNTKGFFGLYRGLSVLLFGTIPKTGVRFGSFEFLKKSAVDDQENLAPHLRALCGLGAGVCESILAVTPAETIKVKFIHDQRLANPRFKGLFHGVGVIIKEHGLNGVYQGVVATTIKQGTTQMMRFFVVETCKDIYRGGDRIKPVPNIFTAIFGFFAGFIAVLGNNPVDVVKTRMQGLEASKYKNTFDCFTKITKNEGLLAFYKGTIPRLSRTCVEGAITFTVYDIIKEILLKIWP